MWHLMAVPTLLTRLYLTSLGTEAGTWQLVGSTVVVETEADVVETGAAVVEIGAVVETGAVVGATVVAELGAGHVVISAKALPNHPSCKAYITSA